MADLTAVVAQCLIVVVLADIIVTYRRVPILHLVCEKCISTIPGLGPAAGSTNDIDVRGCRRAF